MYRSRRPVKWFSFSNERLRFCLGDLSRVSELCRYLFEAIEFRKIRFITYEHEHLLASLFAFFRRHEDAHAWRGCCKLAIVAILVLRVRELVWRADGISQNLLGRRHFVRQWQVIDKLCHEVLLGSVFGDLRTVSSVERGFWRGVFRIYGCGFGGPRRCRCARRFSSRLSARIILSARW